MIFYGDWKLSQEEYPTEPGFYLVYGDPHCVPDDKVYKPKFHILHVMKAANGPFYVIGGHFWYPSEHKNSFFKWRPLEVAAPAL